VCAGWYANAEAQIHNLPSLDVAPELLEYVAKAKLRHGHVSGLATWDLNRRDIGAVWLYVHFTA
jgi:hypothetical protein